jgi:site-specific DNA recombinase
MRVALYVRVSTERQQQAQTIEQQVKRLQEYAAGQDGWEVRAEHVFRDDGHSGAKLNRPGLDALRDQAARAAFDCVLVTAPDRLARNYVHQMVLLEELERVGCRVIFIDRPLSDDPHEQLVVQIRGAVAEYERTLIADRMRRGRQAKLQSGRLLPWTRPPYGYRLHPERPRDPGLVRIDLGEATVVRELFTAYAAGEGTLRALAKWLTDRQVPSPSGRKHWSATSIRGILRNPCYTGQAASGRWQTIASQGRASALRPVGAGTSTRQRPPDEWISIAVPALVETEQYRAVQQRLAHNQQGAMRNSKHPYLLRGLVSCGICRLDCQGRTRHPQDEPYRYYICRAKQHAVASGRDERCPARFIPAQQLDELVWADLRAVLQSPDLVAQAVERAQGGAWVPDELRRRQATLRGVRESLERQRRRLLEAYLAEAVELAEFQRKDGELRQRQEDLIAQEREIAAQGQQQLEVSSLVKSMTAVCERLRHVLSQASFEQRRQLVELLIDRVIVTNGDVEIRYVIPTTEVSTHTRFCHLRTDYFDVLLGEARAHADVAVADHHRLAVRARLRGVAVVHRLLAVVVEGEAALAVAVRLGQEGIAIQWAFLAGPDVGSAQGNAFFVHHVGERPGVDTQRLGVDREAVVPVGVAVAGPDALERHLRNGREAGVEPLGRPDLPLDVAVDLRDLIQQKRADQVVDAIVRREEVVRVGPAGVGAGVARQRGVGEEKRALPEDRVVGQHGAAHAGREVLAAKAEAGDVAQGPNGLALESGEVRLAAVLDQEDLAPVGDLAQRGHVAGIAV